MHDKFLVETYSFVSENANIFISCGSTKPMQMNFSLLWKRERYWSLLGLVYIIYQSGMIRSKLYAMYHLRLSQLSALS